MLTDEGEKSTRCESCVYPAAVFCNVMSIDLLFVPELLGGWGAALPVNLASLLTAACQVRISTQITPTCLTGDIRPEILCCDLMEERGGGGGWGEPKL